MEATTNISSTYVLHTSTNEHNNHGGIINNSSNLIHVKHHNSTNTTHKMKKTKENNKSHNRHTEDDISFGNNCDDGSIKNTITSSQCSAELQSRNSLHRDQQPRQYTSHFDNHGTHHRQNKRGDRNKQQKSENSGLSDALIYHRSVTSIPASEVAAYNQGQSGTSNSKNKYSTAVFDPIEAARASPIHKSNNDDSPVRQSAAAGNLPIPHTSSFQRVTSWIYGARSIDTITHSPEKTMADHVYDIDIDYARRMAGYHETEWTPPDSSYGAAMPVGGWIPKNVRRLIESTLIAGMVLGLVYLLVATSIQVSDSVSDHKSDLSTTSGNTSVSTVDDDDYTANSTGYMSYSTTSGSSYGQP
jgi:hypothetical protein